MVLLLLACGRMLPSPVEASSAAPAGFECPTGSTWTVDPPGRGELRAIPGTEVHTCRDAQGRPVGPHVERWPGGGTACVGSWANGARDGVWLAWRPDGAFRSQVTWRDGVQDGPRREVGRAGRIVEITMEAGLAQGFLTLPSDAPMPEWDGGRRVEGTRYRAARAE